MPEQYEQSTYEGFMKIMHISWTKCLVVNYFWHLPYGAVLVGLRYERCLRLVSKM